MGEGSLRFFNIKSLYKCCRGMVLDWNSKIIKLDKHTQNKMHVFSDTVRWSARRRHAASHEKKVFCFVFLSPEISFVTSDGDKHVSTSTERRDNANMDQALFRPPPSLIGTPYIYTLWRKPLDTGGLEGTGGKWRFSPQSQMGCDVCVCGSERLIRFVWRAGLKHFR